jgi:hypothetical protein
MCPYMYWFSQHIQVIAFYKFTYFIDVLYLLTLVETQMF